MWSHPCITVAGAAIIGMLIFTVAFEVVNRRNTDVR